MNLGVQEFCVVLYSKIDKRFVDNTVTSSVEDLVEKYQSSWSKGYIATIDYTNDVSPDKNNNIGLIERRLAYMFSYSGRAYYTSDALNYKWRSCSFLESGAPIVENLFLNAGDGAMLVTWGPNTLNSPYKAGLTYSNYGWAIVHGYGINYTSKCWYSIRAFDQDDENEYLYTVSNQLITEGTWHKYSFSELKKSVADGKSKVATALSRFVTTASDASFDTIATNISSIGSTSAINFSWASISSNSIRLTWTNPSKGPWNGVFIQMSTDGTPGTGGGTRAYTGAGANPHEANGYNYCDITNLSEGTRYYFTLTSYADDIGWGDSYNLSIETSVDTLEGILRKCTNYGGWSGLLMAGASQKGNHRLYGASLYWTGSEGVPDSGYAYDHTPYISSGNTIYFITEKTGIRYDSLTPMNSTYNSLMEKSRVTFAFKVCNTDTSHGESVAQEVARKIKSTFKTIQSAQYDYSTLDESNWVDYYTYTIEDVQYKYYTGGSTSYPYTNGYWVYVITDRIIASSNSGSSNNNWTQFRRARLTFMK